MIHTGFSKNIFEHLFQYSNQFIAIRFIFTMGIIRFVYNRKAAFYYSVHVHLITRWRRRSLADMKVSMYIRIMHERHLWYKYKRTLATVFGWTSTERCVLPLPIRTAMKSNMYLYDRRSVVYFLLASRNELHSTVEQYTRFYSPKLPSKHTLSFGFHSLFPCILFIFPIFFPSDCNSI